ncbi:MAG TPA: glycosyltransferase [Thermoanaerobaculaceae bacterium]|nr:glycosyltransferase [Thermoanaerobaculaceae bacterium]
MRQAIAAKTMLELEPYLEHVPAWTADELRCLAARFKGATVVHVNSTASGGGVAEILARLVPLQRGLGLDAHWLVLDGDAGFFRTTKKLHNALQGHAEDVSAAEWDHYLEVNRANLESARDLLLGADFVMIHDPQPAALLRLAGGRGRRWGWRCHIDLSHPQRAVWRRLQEVVEPYAASVFSLAAFARRLPHPQVIIPPAIDPLTDKNRPLGEAEVAAVCDRFGVRRDLPLFVQVSRFDRFKDPLGVIAAFRLLRRHRAATLVLAGGSASDDPEGQEVLAEVRRAAAGDKDVVILELPADSNLEVNALQRAATVVIQKSVREGFGLVVTEALWKGRPVIGGAAGGITLQVHDGFTGYLVRTIEGCAYRMRQCLRHPHQAAEMGLRGVELVRGHYLVTRQLRDNFVLLALLRGDVGVGAAAGDAPA